MTSVNQLSEQDHKAFLQVVQESLVVTSRCQLLIWLQGSLQRLLPHDAVISISGDWPARRVRTEVISPAVGGCAATCRPNCNLISHRLLERWRYAHRQMVGFHGSVDGVVSEVCDCDTASFLRSAGSALAHGLRDERSGEETLYVVFGTDFGDERHRTMFSLLLPQIDFACRRGLSPSVQVQPEKDLPVATTTAIGRSDAGISVREQEILGWVRAGKTNYEIGQILNISAFTVKNHLQRIYRKIDVMNRAQAVAKLDQYVRDR